MSRVWRSLKSKTGRCAGLFFSGQLKTLGMFMSTYHGLRYIFDGMLTKERGGLSAKPCMCRLRQLTDDPY